MTGTGSRGLRTLAWLGGHLSREGWLLVAFLLAAVLAHTLSTLVPVFAGRAFGEVTSGHPRLGTVLEIAGIVVLLVLGRFAAEVTSLGSMEIVAQRVKRDSRDELYRSLLRKGQSFHDRQRVGDILARAINDARLVDYMLSPGVATAVNGLVAMVIPLAFIARMRLELLLAPTVLLLLFGVALWHHLHRLHPLSVALRERFAELNSKFSETLAGMATIKAATQERTEAEGFESQASRYREAFVRRGRAQALYLPALSFGLGMAIGAIHALWLYAGGSLSLADVVTYLGWLALFHLPISMSESSVPVIQEGFVAAGRMLFLISDSESSVEAEDGVTETVDGAVTFDHVSFSYEGTDILHDVSFHVPAGTSLAIVGPTGSGKTMLTKLVNRTYEPTSGRVLIDGRDNRAWEPGRLRRQIAYVHQDGFLFSKSVADNLAFGSHSGATEDDLREAARKARAHEFIQALPEGYGTVLNEGGTTLSGGQRQRLMIARALLADPRILVLDDATSAVDARTEQAITEAIRALLEGRTTLLISHRLRQIRQADQIVVLEHGRVADVGSHETLLGRCVLYRGLYANRAFEPDVLP